MGYMMRLLRWFGLAWFILIGLLAVVSTLATLLLADSLWQGFQQVREIWSPFTLANYIVVVVTLSPGLGALWLSDYLNKRQK